MPMRSRLAVVLSLAVLTAAGALLASSTLVLDYDVSMHGEKAGTSRAVIDDSASGRRLEITTEVETTFMGKKVQMTSRSVVNYDKDKRATSFDIRYEKPTGNIYAKGKRSNSGWDITRKEGKKKKKIRIEDDTYDRVSLEPSLYAGEVGSTTKVRVLFAGKGKVKKATIIILGHKTKKVLGHETGVTHFRIKSGYGSVEEWRMDSGVILRSKVKTPIGKILIVLKGPAEQDS